jgi:pimeloyl-ACP methyl ester carboxylesterase
MPILSNIVIQTPNHPKPFGADIYYQPTGSPKPIVILCHGIRGFKDWGLWHPIALRFMQQQFIFIKFNFSHNGVTLQNPLQYDDLQAFANNNYSWETKDLHTLISWVQNHSTHTIPPSEANTNQIYIIGHSRGGGVALACAAADTRITKVATLAAVDKLDFLWHNKPDMLQQWQHDGVFYTLNTRTQQQMPIHFQMYLDYQQNLPKFNLEQLVPNITQPLLIVHGTADQAVPLSAANNLHQWNKKSQLITIGGADHVFGGTHPYPHKHPTPHAQLATNAIIQFFKQTTY